MKKSYIGKTILALGGAAALAGGCATKDLKDNASLAESVRITVNNYAQDKQLDVKEMQEIGKAYIRIDNALQDGIKNEEEKTLLEQRRDLLGTIITAYFEGGNFNAYGFVSGMEPGYTQLRNSGGQTPLPLRLQDEQKTIAETFTETRARAELVSKIREAWESISHPMSRESIDNERFHAAFREVSQKIMYEWLANKTPYGVFGGRDGEARWTKDMHEAYFGENGKGGNHTAVSLIGKEAFKISDDLEKTIMDSLGEKKETTQEDPAAALESAQKAYDEANQKLEEAKKAKEEADKAEEGAK